MGKKVWIQIDEDEIEYLEDAGLTVTQVDPRKDGAKVMSHTEIYHQEALQLTPDQAAAFGRMQGARVAAFWQRGIMNLSRQVVDETAWVASPIRYAEVSLPTFTFDELFGKSFANSKTFKVAMETLARNLGASSELFRRFMEDLPEGAINHARQTVEIDPDSPAAQKMKEALARKREAQEHAKLYGEFRHIPYRPPTKIKPTKFTL